MIWNFHKLSVFQSMTAGYTKSHHLEKSLKAINNILATEIWRLLTCQNCQMICKPYYWDKQHASTSLLILMTDWLMAIHCSRFIWVFLMEPHQFYQHETIFLGYFWIVTNNFKIYFWNVSETLLIRHHFWDTFETS